MHAVHWLESNRFLHLGTIYTCATGDKTFNWYHLTTVQYSPSVHAVHYCHVTSVDFSDYKRSSHSSLVAIPMTSPDQTVNVTVGDNLTLMVDITEFNLPLDSVTWMEDGQLLMNNTDNIVITHGSFEAPPTTSTLVRDPIQSPTDNGTYEVTVVNPAGQSMTTFTVIVNGRQINFMVFSSPL